MKSQANTLEKVEMTNEVAEKERNEFACNRSMQAASNVVGSIERTMEYQNICYILMNGGF